MNLKLQEFKIFSLCDKTPLRTKDILTEGSCAKILIDSKEREGKMILTHASSRCCNENTRCWPESQLTEWELGWKCLSGDYREETPEYSRYEIILQRKDYAWAWKHVKMKVFALDEWWDVWDFVGRLSFIDDSFINLMEIRNDDGLIKYYALER